MRFSFFIIDPRNVKAHEQYVKSFVCLLVLPLKRLETTFPYLDHRSTKPHEPYVKSFVRKAQALLGLKSYRLAADVCQEGLKLDAFHPALRQASEAATQGILKDLLTGVRCTRCWMHFCGKSHLRGHLLYHRRGHSPCL